MLQAKRLLTVKRKLTSWPAKVN